MSIPRRNKIEQEDAQAAALPQEKRRRGQSLVELALLLPLLVLLLSVVIEAGLILNAWLRVNTASRDATRFLLDQGRQGDITNLVLYKLKGVDFGSSKEITGSLNIDIFKVEGATDSSGNIPSSGNQPNGRPWWKADQIYNGNGSSDVIQISRTAIQTRLQAIGNASNITFVIVEVQFKYTPVLATLIAPGAQISMSNYAIIQKDPNN
ncbi:MAG: TadE/TadG family type IV pilus assembly protein [Chloroflexia bacterium]